MKRRVGEEGLVDLQGACSTPAFFCAEAEARQKTGQLPPVEQAHGNGLARGLGGAPRHGGEGGCGHKERLSRSCAQAGPSELIHAALVDAPFAKLLDLSDDAARGESAGQHGLDVPASSASAVVSLPLASSSERGLFVAEILHQDADAAREGRIVQGEQLLPQPLFLGTWGGAGGDHRPSLSQKETMPPAGSARDQSPGRCPRHSGRRLPSASYASSGRQPPQRHSAHPERVG